MISHVTFLYLALLSALPLAFAAKPTLIYALQDQLPPVARVNSIWSWTLFKGTFVVSDGSSISYTASDLPAWASFDASTQTFTGTPSSSNTGSTTVTVKATSSSGGSNTGTFNLLVTDDAAPYVLHSIQGQLAAAVANSYGAFLQSDGVVRSPPSWTYSLGFQWNSYQDSTGSKIYYAARVAQTTSLPDWLKFENTTVTFDALAPAAAQAGKRYVIEVVGSDRFGYGDIIQNFTLTTSSQSFAYNTPIPSLNATAGELVNYTIPLTGLTIDNATATSSTVTTAVDLSAAKFLTYDSSNRFISGTIPSSAVPQQSYAIPVNFTSSAGTITTIFSLDIVAGLFSSSTLPNITVNPGQAFVNDITSYITTQTATYSATFSPTSASNWMKFDASSLRLSGTPPQDSIASDYTVTFTANDASTGRTGSAQLLVQNSGNAEAGSGGDPNSPGQLHSGKGSNLSNGAKIALSVLGGIAAGLLILALLLFCCRRHNKENPKRKIISSPISSHEDKNTMTSGGRSPLLSFFPSLNDRAPASPTTIRNSFDVLAKPGEDRDAVSINMPSPYLNHEPVIVSPPSPVAYSPQRFDLLRAISPEPYRASTQPSQKSAYASGVSSVYPLDTPRQTNIMVMTEGDGIYRSPSIGQSQESIDQALVDYVAAADSLGDARADQMEEDEEDDMYDETQDIRSQTSRTSSTWPSRASSSLFYSDHIPSEHDSPTRHSQRSAPRQRKDFAPPAVPLPPLTYQSAIFNKTKQAHMQESSSPGGIRILNPGYVADGHFV